LGSGANLQCQGTATQPVNFFRYNTVQEQSNTNWSLPYPYRYEDLECDSATNLISLRFVYWSASAGDTIMDLDNPTNSIPMFGCQFYNAAISSIEPTMLATNCLFRRIALDLEDGLEYHTFYNNLFEGGSLTAYHYSSGTWTFSDNFFDQTIITQYADPMDVASNNAFDTNFDRLLPTNANDVVLCNSPAYETGALGVYYYPCYLPLIHAGSRPAPSAGLYHYTVTTNNAVEGINQVSIGYHYVATGTNGLPLDSNGDGIPDYLRTTMATVLWTMVKRIGRAL
jgi:hypothetical protein